MDGHAMALGGAIVDSGNFDWSAYPDKFPGLCAPDESYHGVVYTEKFGKAAYITKATSPADARSRRGTVSLRTRFC